MTTPSIKLHGFRLSGHAHRARLFLSLLGLPFENIDVDLPNKAHKSPAFLAMDKNNGKVLWSDNSPGANVLHGQWSSPAYGKLGGVDQVLFGGGDGWLYSFDPKGDNGKAKLLWKFDCNCLHDCTQ